MKPQSRHAGFTLIEMLVVIVITGIIITVAMIALGGLNKGRDTKMAAEQLQRAMQTAKAQAILMPQTLRLRFEGSGYRFYSYTKGKNGKYGWSKLENDNLSQLDAFARGVRLKILSTGKKKSNSDESGIRQMILFSQSGDVTPFALELFASDQSACFKLSLGNSGKFNLKACRA